MGGRPKKNIVVDSLYREIVFQSYASLRLTGLPASQVNRLIRSGLRSKYILTAFYGFAFVVIMAATLALNSEAKLVFPLEAFIWVFLLVFLPTLQLSYGASAGGQIRELLETLPMRPEQIERLAARAIIKTIDTPLMVAFGILVLGGLFAGPLFAASSIMAGLSSVSVAMVAVLLLMRTFRRFSTTSRLGSLLRSIVFVPAIFIWVITNYITGLKVAPTTPATIYAPILNYVGASAGIPQAVYLSLVYTAILVFAGYRSFLSASTLLLSPIVGAPLKAGRFRVKVRSQLASIVVTDLRQVARSPRLIGFFVTPLLLVAFLVYDLYFGGSIRSLGFNFVYLQDIVPSVFAVSYLPYVLYLGELRGYSYFKILPVRNSLNILSKMLTTLIVFGVLATVMSYAAYAALHNPYIFASVYSLALPLAASVLLTTAYFHYSIKRMALGVANTLTGILFTIINIFVIGIPVGVYYTAMFTGAPHTTALLYMGIASLTEMVVLLLVEKRFR